MEISRTDTGETCLLEGISAGDLIIQRAPCGGVQVKDSPPERERRIASEAESRQAGGKAVHAHRS